MDLGLGTESATVPNQGHIATLEDVNYIWNLEERFCLMQASMSQIVVLNDEQSLYKHLRCSGKRTGPGVNKAGLSTWAAWAGEIISGLSLNFLTCTVSYYNSAELHFWVICCVLDDSWQVPTQLWQKTQEGWYYERSWGQGTPKAYGCPKRGCELYFPEGLGQPSRLGAWSSCGPREAAGSKGIQMVLSHPLPHQPALCKNSKLPIKPPSLFSFHSPAHLPLLFSPFSIQTHN